MRDSDLQAIYEKYLENYRRKDYERAKSYLLKYIGYADRAGSRGTYYYTLEYLINDISMKDLDPKVIEESRKLGEDYKKELDEGNFRKALILSKLQYELTEGKDFYSIVHMAEANIEMGKFDEANKYLEQALSMNPDSPKVYATIVKMNVRQKDIKEAEKNLRRLKFLDKKNKYYFYLYRYEIACLTGNDKGLSNYDLVVRSEISPKDYDKYQHEKELFDKRFSGVKKVVQAKNNNDKRELEMHLSNMSKFLEPDSDNIVRPRRVFDYLDNIVVDDDKKGLYNLEAAKLLAENGYFDLASKLVRKTEKIENKSTELKDRMKSLSKEMKLIKYR